VVFAACFVLSPANGWMPVTVVSAVLSLAGFGARKDGPDFGRTTRLGPARKAVQMGRISTPVHTAQRRRPPKL
jgi:hypothetical protein